MSPIDPTKPKRYTLHVFLAIIFLGFSLFVSLASAQDISLSYIDPATEQILSTHVLNETTEIAVPDTTLSLLIESIDSQLLVPNVTIQNNTNLTLSVRDLSKSDYIDAAYERMPGNEVLRYSIKRAIYVDISEIVGFDTPLETTFATESIDFNRTDKITTIYMPIQTPALVNETFDYTAIDFQNREIIDNSYDSSSVSMKTDGFGVYLLAEDKARPEICGNGIDEDFDGKDKACPSSPSSGGSGSRSSSRSSSSTGPIQRGSISENYTITSDPCKNKRLDGNETDIDCGGPQCPACEIEKNCSIDSDCTTDYCNTRTNTCTEPTCSDRIKNGNETDVDCGGDCGPCDRYEECKTDADCVTGYCSPSIDQCLTKPQPTTEKDDEPKEEKPTPVQPKPPEQEPVEPVTDSTFPWTILVSFVVGSALIGTVVYQAQQRGFHIKGLHYTGDRSSPSMDHVNQPLQTSAQPKQTSESSAKPTNGADLTKYIKRELQKGFTKDAITTKLLDAGWNKKDIDNAFEKEKATNNTAVEKLDQSRLQALQRYVYKNREQGVDIDTIRSTLEKSEWPQEYINQAIRSFNRDYTTETKVPVKQQNNISKQTSTKTEPQEANTKQSKNSPITLSFAENLILEEEALGTDPTLLYNTFLKKKWPRYMIDQAFANVQKKCEETKDRMGKQKFNQALLFALVSLNKRQPLTTVLQTLQQKGYPKQTREILCREIHALQDELIRYDLDKPKISKKKAQQRIESLRATYPDTVLSAALQMLGWKRRTIDMLLQKKQKSYK